MSRKKQRSAFDQVSEFDRGRIVAYRDCELSFRKISSRVGQNQKPLIRIWDRWMHDGSLSHIISVSAQHIESVTHHSVSAHSILRCLQQSGPSARRPLLGLPLTQNHRRLRLQWCDERRMLVAEWKEVVFTDESRICLQHHDG
ncbi:transposable element Tc1 transposase [Trichonephila clavipes]|nr:transposable element Tc1 transposase [Trichonephila clavipes]